MGFFATRTRGATGDPGATALPAWIRRGLPPRFEAVAEAMASGSDSVQACEVVGRALARDGVSLDEALSGLRETSRVVTGADPDFVSLQALCRAWSETTLSYLHQLSCTDPLTGLSTLAHLRTAVADLYRSVRGHGRGQEHALVVVETAPHASNDDEISRAMRMVRLGEHARTVFAGCETIGALGARRVVALAVRDDRLARRVSLLRRLVEPQPARVWIEGLPDTDHGAAVLLDELSRD